MIIKILNKKWKIKVLNPTKYRKTIGEGSAAECHTEIKTIFIHQDSMDLKTIRHELGHAFCSELGMVELQLDEDQMEEFFCELLARHFDDVKEISERVYKYFKRT